MRMQLFKVWEQLRASYWFVPSTMAVASAGLAFGCISLDAHFRDEAVEQLGWIYTGGPEGARAVLATIAGSIITVAGTTFSITIAALSLASAQYGPRLLRNFMRDTGNQVVLGAFTATFLYCLLVLRTVRGLDSDTYVPHISVTVGVVLAVLSVGVLIYFIHHVAESIQVAHIVDKVGTELDHTIDRLFPQSLGTGGAEIANPVDPEDAVPVLAVGGGYVQAINDGALIALSCRLNAVLHLHIRPGHYLIPGMRIASASPRIDDEGEEEIRDSLAVGRQRTAHQDVEFAFLQVVEIAVRSLSPGINDPFTAITCIDRITKALCAFAERRLPSPFRYSDDGILRVIAHPYTYDEIVSAAFRHIRENATDHLIVIEHLRSSIDLILNRTSNPEFRAALLHEKNQTS